MLDKIDALDGLVECTLLTTHKIAQIFAISTRPKSAVSVKIPGLVRRTFVMSSTTTTSNLSPWSANSFFRCAPFASERTVPRTAYPFSSNVRTTHAAMYPFAPDTSTLLGDATAGILAFFLSSVIVSMRKCECGEIEKIKTAVRNARPLYISGRRSMIPIAVWGADQDRHDKELPT